MTNLIEDVTRDFREFWELPVMQSRRHSYRKTTFDKINASLLFERLAESGEKDDLAIVMPDDPTVPLLVIIEGLLSLLKYDLLMSSSQVLAGLNPGDQVGLIDQQTRKVVPGIFRGTEDSFYRVETVEKSAVITNKIPAHRSWRIQPFQSSSGKGRAATLAGQFLEEIIGLPAGGVMAVQQSKALIVTAEKGKTLETLKDVLLGEESIESIFPMCNYGNVESPTPIGSNALQREPLLGFVANTDMAVDIALDDPKVKLIIIDGASKVRAHYPDIERLNYDDKPRKIVCLLKSTDEDEIKTLADMGIDTWVWRRRDFAEMTELSTLRLRNNQTPFAIHNRFLNYLAGPEPDVTVIEHGPIDENVAAFLKGFRKISNSLPVSEDAGLILRWSVSLFNSLLQLPLPMNDYEQYLSTVEGGARLLFENRITSLHDKLKDAYGFAIPSALQSDCEKMIGVLRDIHAALKLQNPKALMLDALIEERHNNDVTVVCCRPEYAAAIKHTNRHQGVNAVTLSEAGMEPEEDIIITGWYNRRIMAKFFLSPHKKQQYLFYSKEKQAYDQLLRTHPCSSESLIDSHLREAYKQPVEDTASEASEVEAAPEEERRDDIDTLLSQLIKKFGRPSYGEQFQGYDKADFVEAHMLVFEDDSYTYATDTYQFNRLARENHSYKKCKLQEVNPGDEFIFASSERDLFDEVIGAVGKTAEYRELWHNATLWRKALEKYIETHNTDEAQLLIELRLAGFAPDLGTLRSWLKGTTITPSGNGYSAVYAIAKLTRDRELTDRVDKVIEAHKKITAIHIQTGKVLVRSIISAVARDEEDDISDDLRQKIESYSHNARVVTLREISSDKMSVPPQVVGRLQEAAI